MDNEIIKTIKQSRVLSVSLLIAIAFIVIKLYVITFNITYDFLYSEMIEHQKKEEIYELNELLKYTNLGTIEIQKFQHTKEYMETNKIKNIEDILKIKNKEDAISIFQFKNIERIISIIEPMSHYEILKYSFINIFYMAIITTALSALAFITLQICGEIAKKLKKEYINNNKNKTIIIIDRAIIITLSIFLFIISYSLISIETNNILLFLLIIFLIKSAFESKQLINYIKRSLE